MFPIFVSQELLVRFWSLWIVKTQLLVGWVSVCDFCWRACIGNTWEKHRETVRETVEKKKEKRLIEGKRMEGRAGVWLSSEEIFSAVCSLSIHGGQPFICCLCGQAETEREMVVWGRRKQAELPGMTWEWGRKKRREREWENKINTSEEERFYIPWILIWQEKVEVYW